MDDLTNKKTPSKKNIKSVLKFCPMCKRRLIEETPDIMTYLTCLDCNCIVDYYYPQTEIPIYDKKPCSIKPKLIKDSSTYAIQKVKKIKYKDPIMENQILSLQEKLELPSFNNKSIENIIRLQMQLLFHIKNKNVEKVAIYIRFILEQWPDIRQCPLDINLIIDALRMIKNE